MRIHILKLKAELKVLAETIRTVKFNTRQDQSAFDKQYPLRHEYDQYKILRNDEQFKTAQKECWNNQSNLYSARFEFRSKHIAYCMLRGKTLEQIEPKLKDPNDPLHASVRKEAARIVTEIVQKEAADANPKS